MPLTARLSSHFYERLGDTATNELVDWLNTMDANSERQLQEFHERSTASFRAEMQARFAEQDARIAKQFAEQEVRLMHQISALDARVTREIAELRHEFGRLEARFAWQMLGVYANMVGLLISIAMQLFRH